MDELLDDAHQFGNYLADGVIDTYGLEIANEQVDEAVAFVTRDIFERVREMWLRGNADTGGRRLGPCVCQCPSRPHPAASGYLMMGAALVPFEPAAAMRKQAVISGAEARPEPYCKSDDHPLRTHHWYYERDAIAWDTDRGRNLVEKLWLDRFTSLLPGGGSVLDLGCGSGEPIGRYLTEHGLSVIGIDSSPTLISLCKERFPEQEWLAADMRTLSLSRSFHGVLAWDSFFHLSHQDQRAMFAVSSNHAMAGGALMFTSGPSHGEAVGSYRGEPLYHASLGEPEYRALLSAHGFHVVRHVVVDPNCGGHTVWLAQLNAPR